MPSTDISGNARLVLASDVLIRPRGGMFLLHRSGTQGQVFETQDPQLVTWVCAFAHPRDPQEVLAALAPAEREAAARLLEQLQSIGILQRADRLDRNTDFERQHAESTQQLAALAQSVYDLAGDLRGLGPYAHAQLDERTGYPIALRLSGLLAAIDALKTELTALRPDYIERQLQALGVSADTPELKLHLGSGGAHLAGWINMDVHPAPLALNINWGLPFAAGRARYVFLAHLLEHLFYPQQAMPLLAEIRRVLAPGGIVRIVVPDAEQCLRAYVENDPEFFDSRRSTWTWWPENPTRLEDFLAYLGAGPNPALLFESHKFGYDFETLKRALEHSGFTAIRQCGYMQSPHPELRIDNVSAVAGARHGDRYYSLFVEASCPTPA